MAFNTSRDEVDRGKEVFYRLGLAVKTNQKQVCLFLSSGWSAYTLLPVRYRFMVVASKITHAITGAVVPSEHFEGEDGNFQQLVNLSIDFEDVKAYLNSSARQNLENRSNEDGSARRCLKARERSQRLFAHFNKELAIPIMNLQSIRDATLSFMAAMKPLTVIKKHSGLQNIADNGILIYKVFSRIIQAAKENGDPVPD
ncbi:hypothetical protein NliqN6_2180 [Naganishia liquefaciens]|uniref:Uncharacterized protein n=1 Tax=Naganishia liquefaciens TaxID=104408 RepID=A0A8H3YE10_9TREE|nr:hypothetical protein NliqN6_2180 [Naganishia liquefaciens]